MFTLYFSLAMPVHVLLDSGGRDVLMLVHVYTVAVTLPLEHVHVLLAGRGRTVTSLAHQVSNY